MTQPPDIPIEGQRRPLGSRFLLIATRAFQFGWTFFIVFSFYRNSSPHDGFYTKVVFAILAILFWVSGHWCAYGAADEKGITFRRYFKRYFVPWSQVKKASWGGRRGPALVIQTQHPLGWSRRIEFQYLDPHRWAPWPAFRTTWTPDDVTWVLNRVNFPRQFTITVGAPASRDS
jgi:hypothetical protein